MNEKINQQKEDYEAAFSTDEAPGYKFKALGILVMVGGIIWSVLSYLNGSGSLLPLPPAVAIIGAVIICAGELNEIRYTLVQNQLKQEYYMKYGDTKPKDE